jgi:hypothetical protein
VLSGFEVESEGRAVSDQLITDEGTGQTGTIGREQPWKLVTVEANGLTRVRS